MGPRLGQISGKHKLNSTNKNPPQVFKNTTHFMQWITCCNSSISIYSVCLCECEKKKQRMQMIEQRKRNVFVQKIDYNSVH